MAGRVSQGGSAEAPPRVTRTRPVRGSTVQTKIDPGSTPSSAAIGAGTVVRTDADRLSTRTARDSKDLAIVFDQPEPPLAKRRVGQPGGRHVGTNLKYSRAVGQLVGRQMGDNGVRMTGREIRALEMLRDGNRVADSQSPGGYLVASQAGHGFYRVTGATSTNRGGACTCPDFAERSAPCKHMLLVEHWLKAADSSPGLTGSPFKEPPPGRAPIDWTTYNSAQTEEYRLFNVLLHDLSVGVLEPTKDPHRAGRPPIPLREQAFCAVQKSYLGSSCRRSHGFRAEAAKNGFLTTTPYWALPSRFLCRDDVTENLHAMLARSALPLIGLEDRCAIDSTGLRTTRFHSYRKERYEPSRQNIWRKLHALVGVKTHVIPVLEVTDGSANDSPQFRVLLSRAAAAGFAFKEVYADKGYQSRDNFNAAAELQIEPYIPFKRNQTGQSKGSAMFHRMFLFFQYHREEFDRHYGQRAQVESAFGSFKAKFGETLASKNIRAQINEVLSKAIAHNITVLIRQMFEVGIRPEFLGPGRREREIQAPTSTPERPAVEIERSWAGLVH